MPPRATATGLSPAWAAGCLILIILGVMMFFFMPSVHPAQLAFRIALIGIGLFGLIMATIANIRTRNRTVVDIPAIARQILHQQKSLYGAPHEYTPANSEEFSDFDRSFYDDAQRQLEAQGFRFVEDVENLTLSRNLPALRTFARTMTGDDDTIVARIYQLLPLGRAGRDIRTVELTTEFNDFTFLITTNAEITLDASDIRGITITRFPSDTSALDLLAQHRAALADLRGKSAGVQPVRCPTLDAILTSTRHGHAVRAVHRKRHGYVTLDDMKLLRGEPLTAVDQQIFEEINQLEARERAADTAGQ